MGSITFIGLHAVEGHLLLLVLNGASHPVQSIRGRGIRRFQLRLTVAVSLVLDLGGQTAVQGLLRVLRVAGSLAGRLLLGLLLDLFDLGPLVLEPNLVKGGENY